MPGIGKSSLAAAFVRRHPLSLVVDVDTIRTQLGRWESHVESQVIARDLAIVLVDAQLSSGRDAVVPQFLGREAFIERLSRTAAAAEATFIEVMLVGEPRTAVQRFQDRRARAGKAQHPERDVADHEIASVVAAAAESLSSISASRTVIQVMADDDLEAICDRLERALLT